MKIFLGYLITFTYIFFVIFSSSYLRKKKLISHEGERKIVHIFMSFCLIPIYFLIYPNINFAVIPLIFVLTNYFLKNKGPLNELNRDKQNDTYGTVFYAISICVMACFTLLDNKFLMPYIIGLYCMAFADGLAGFFSRRIKGIIFKNKKTLVGSISVAVVSFIVILFVNMLFENPLNIWVIMILSVLSSIFEFIGYKGYDNLTLPLGLSVVTYLFLIL